MKVRFLFAWYDCWVGVFIDRPGRRVFIFPVPMFGIRYRKAAPMSDPYADELEVMARLAGLAVLAAEIVAGAWIVWRVLR